MLTATVNGKRPSTVILSAPLREVTVLRLEILSIDNKDEGSLRADVLGCQEGGLNCIFRFFQAVIAVNYNVSILYIQ